MIAIAYLRSALYYVLLVTSLLLYSPIVFATKPLGYDWHWRAAYVWLWLHQQLVRYVCGLKLSVHGREHLPDKPAVLLIKHQSMLETLTTQLIFPRQTWVLKQELLSVPLFGWALAMLKPVHIDRGSAAQALKSVLRQGAARLQEGLWLVIFPEGTRVLPGQNGNWAKGGALLAKRAGAPVVPVAHNAGEFWLRHRFLIRPGVWQLHIGPPIETADASVEAVNEQARTWVESRMAELERDTAR